jgi:hypothetical protein
MEEKMDKKNIKREMVHHGQRVSSLMVRAPGLHPAGLGSAPRGSEFKQVWNKKNIKT